MENGTKQILHPLRPDALSLRIKMNGVGDGANIINLFCTGYLGHIWVG